jgi:hypothetical protein
MQFKSLIIKDCFRDIVGSISLEELISNQTLSYLLTQAEFLMKLDAKELLS